MKVEKMYYMIIGLISLGILLGATSLRFSHRNEKTEEEIKKAKNTSWLMFFLALIFFLVGLFIGFHFGIE